MKDVRICKKCGHNMGRSKCYFLGESPPAWEVRCNKCKSWWKVTITFPKEKKEKKK